MTDNQRVLDIEQKLFSSFQSHFNKSIHALRKMKRNITKKELVSLIEINNTIRELQCKLLDLNYSFINKNNYRISKLNNLSKEDLEAIKENDDNEELIKKFLPMMMLYKLHQDGVDITELEIEKEIDKDNKEEGLDYNVKQPVDVDYNIEDVD